MKKRDLGQIGLFLFMFSILQAQTGNGLKIRYEELTAIEFSDALSQSGRTVIIPFGILEKHGPHLPLGTDMIDIREVVLRAAADEYTIIFPQYYFGQIFEAKHQPGTIAYSHDLIWNMLQETCDELARNGFKKIIIANGHGGNNYFLRYFCQAQLETPHSYVVYLFMPAEDPETEKQVAQMRKSMEDGHAGETETSTMLSYRPDLVRLDKAGSQNGGDQHRLADLKDAYVGIWWYARYPNHYAGDGTVASAELGKVLMNSDVRQLTQMIKSVKQDTMALYLQNRFFREAENPLETKQK
jgi:creatinine amidohydrolase